MTPASITLSIGGNVWFLIPAALLLASLAALFYKFTLPPLPPARRTVLSILRALALILLVLILFEPILRLVSRDKQQPVIAVLIDESQSMALKDAAGDRGAMVKDFLRKGNIAGGMDASIRYYPFSSTLFPPMATGVAESVAFVGQATNLSEAFSRLIEKIPNENIQAVVLVSDGNMTEGKNPLYLLDKPGIPIYTVGVGDTMEQRDLLVDRIVINEIAYSGARIPLDVTVKSSGYGGESVEVMLTEGRVVIERKTVLIREGTAEYPLSFSILANEVGTRKLTLSVSPLPGELTARNNTRSVFIKVLNNKLQVLLIAGAPSPDVAAVRQALSEDQRIQLTALVQRDASRWYEGANLSRSMLDSTDCLVLIGFPSAATNGALLQQVIDLLSQQKKPLLYIHGRNVDYAKLQLLEPELPFRWSSVSREEFLVLPSVAERQKSHSLVHLEGAFTAGDWQKLPPIFKAQTTFHAAPGADVLVQAKTQNIILGEPLILLRTLNRQKTVAVTGHGIWRWRLLAQGTRETEEFLPLFLSNSIQWLATKDDQKHVRIAPAKEIFTTAEQVQFSGQVYDDQLRPVDDAQVIVELVRAGARVKLALDPIGNGRYEGRIDGMLEGDYEFSGAAVREGHTFGVDKGKFSVGEVNVEFIETKMNLALLEQLAFKTGGKFLHIREATEAGEILGPDIRLVPKEIVTATEIELWNWQYIALIIVTLLGIEWFLRRRSGML